jgi:hypothetical protein
MAKRRVIELPPGVEPFNRTAGQWDDLGAPEWVIDAGAATEIYVQWARNGYGRGADPTDEVIRRYYVEMAWLKRCIRPQFLVNSGALTDAEMQLLTARHSARWGRPGRCWTPMLHSEADCPPWLACCRQGAAVQRRAPASPPTDPP